MAIQNTSNITSKFTLPDSTTKDSSFESNTTTTANLTEEFLKVKSSNSSYATLGETLTQTITLTNNSSYELSSISITDTISTGASFVAGSVKIDGTSYSSYDIVTGFTLPTSLPSSDSTVITYEMKIDDQTTQTQITNTATIAYTADSTNFSENTNTVTVALVENKITIVKSASANVVKQGDTITFTIVITNEGTFPNTNIQFVDPIPSGTTFVTDSVKIDGETKTGYNPATGFALDDLDSGESTTVTFDVTVD